LVGKVRHIIGNTIKNFGIKNVSPFVSKVLQGLTNILPKQSRTIHGRKENGRVMFHEFLPHSFQLAQTQEIITSSPMLHVNLLQQTSDTSSTLAHGAMNTPILSQPHFWKNVRMTLTLLKKGNLGVLWDSRNFRAQL